MKTNSLYLIISISLGLVSATSAWALTNSINNVQAKKLPGVVQLTWLDGKSLGCTGEIVGLNPTTVITAAHCLSGGNNYLRKTAPTGVCTLSTATHDEGSTDIAVLVYKNVDLSTEISKDQVFTVAPLPLKLGQTIELCGYGDTSNQEGVGPVSAQLLCGTNELFQVNGQSSSLAGYQPPFTAREQSAMQLELDADVLDNFRLVVTIADNGILGPNSSRKVNNNSGDSGSPWFIEDKKGLHLLGITSWNTSFSEDPAFSDMIFLSSAINLNSVEAKKTLRTAVNKYGAQIKGLQDLTAQ